MIYKVKVMLIQQEWTLWFIVLDQATPICELLQWFCYWTLKKMVRLWIKKDMVLNNLSLLIQTGKEIGQKFDKNKKLWIKECSLQVGH